MNIRTSISSGRGRSEPGPLPRSILRSSRFAFLPPVFVLCLLFLGGCAVRSGMHEGEDLYGAAGSGPESVDQGILSVGKGEDEYSAAESRGAAAGSGVSGRAAGSGADVYGSAVRRSALTPSEIRVSRGTEQYPRRRQAAPSPGRKRIGGSRSEDVFGSSEPDGQQASDGTEIRVAGGRDVYGADRPEAGAGPDKESPVRGRQDGENDVYGVSGERRKPAGSKEAETATTKTKTIGPAEAAPTAALSQVVSGEAAPPAPAVQAAEEQKFPVSGPAADIGKPEIAKAVEEAPVRVMDQPAAPLPSPAVEPVPSEEPALAVRPSSEPASVGLPAPLPGGKPLDAPAMEPTPAVTPPPAGAGPAPPPAPERIVAEIRQPDVPVTGKTIAESPVQASEPGKAAEETPGVTVVRREEGTQQDVPETGPFGTAATGTAPAGKSGIAGPTPSGEASDLYRVSKAKKGPRMERDMVGVVEDLYRGKVSAVGPGWTLPERDSGIEADPYDRKHGAGTAVGRVEGATVEGATDDYNVSASRGLPGKGIVVINRPPNISGMTGLMITNSAYSIAEGKRVAGISFLAEESGSPDFRVMQLPLTLTFGIAKDMEIGVKAKVVDIYNKTPLQDERGFGDTEVSFKWHFVKEGLILPDLALGVGAILPMASEQRGLNEVMDWGLKLMAMASQEKRITENVIMGAYMEAQAVFIDEFVKGGSTPGAERYGMINIGVLFPVTSNNRLQLIAEHNQILYKSSYQPTLLEGNQSATTGAVRYVTERMNLTVGAQYIDKEMKGADSTVRIIGTASYPF